MTPELQQKIENLIARNAQNDDKETLFQLKKLLYAEDDFVIKESVAAADIVAETLLHIKNKTYSKNVIATGFHDLDNLLGGGFNLGEFVVIGARPAMGKTSFLINLAFHISRKFPVLYFSLEMSNSQIIKRLITSIAEIESNKLHSGTLSAEECEKTENKLRLLQKMPLFFQDSSNKSIAAIRAHCEQQIRNNGIRVIMIDCLQQLSSPPHRRQYRELEVAHICRELKNIAKELNVCIIGLSQLNRSVECRGGNKRPQLFDLRESGAIEQDADKVLFIHRPEYYGLAIDEFGNSTKDVAEIIVAKNRIGITDDVCVRFVPKYLRFENFPEKRGFQFSANRLEELELAPSLNENVQKVIENLDLEPF